MLAGLGEKYWLGLDGYTGSAWRVILARPREKYGMGLWRNTGCAWREILAGPGEKYWLGLKRNTGWAWGVTNRLKDKVEGRAATGARPNHLIHNCIHFYI